MEVILYTCTEDNRVVEKSPVYLNKISAKLKKDCSIFNPVIELSKSNVSLSRANYCYISEYGRYYYITDIVTCLGQVVELHLQVDVLNSFNGAIKGLSCVIDRQEFLTNNYIQDSKLPIRSQRIIANKSIGSLGNNSTIILTVTSGINDPVTDEEPETGESEGV